MNWNIIRTKMKRKIRVNNFKSPDNTSGKPSDNPSDNSNNNPSENPKDKNSYIYFGRLGHDAARDKLEFNPGDRVKLEPGSDIYYISTLSCRRANKYILCDSDGTVKQSEIDSSRLTLVKSSAYEASESEDVSEADK